MGIFYIPQVGKTYQHRWSNTKATVLSANEMRLRIQYDSGGTSGYPVKAFVLDFKEIN